MANWTLTQATAKVKMFLRPLNASFYKDDAGTDAPITDFLNEGIADMTVIKAPYMIWNNHEEPCVDTRRLILKEEMLSIKRVERLTSETDLEPVLLLRPDDYDIHELYLEFVEPQTGVIRILGTRRPTPLVLATDTMPFGSPFQLAVVYFAVAALTLSGGNAGVSLSGQYMNYYLRIKSLWETQTSNEGISLRGQSFNPANRNFGLLDIVEGDLTIESRLPLMGSFVGL